MRVIYLVGAVASIVASGLLVRGFCRHRLGARITLTIIFLPYVFLEW